MVVHNTFEESTAPKEPIGENDHNKFRLLGVLQKGELQEPMNSQQLR